MGADQPYAPLQSTSYMSLTERLCRISQIPFISGTDRLLVHIREGLDMAHPVCLPDDWGGSCQVICVECGHVFGTHSSNDIDSLLGIVVEVSGLDEDTGSEGVARETGLMKSDGSRIVTYPFSRAREREPNSMASVPSIINTGDTSARRRPE